MTFTFKEIALMIVGVVLAAAGILAIFIQPMQVEGASFPTAPAFKVATTSTAVSVSGVSTRVLATTTANDLVPNGTRAYATICNPSSTIVHLRFHGDAPVVTGQGTIMIGAAAGYNACYELTDDRMIYLGSIQASSTAGTVSVSVTEYVY